MSTRNIARIFVQVFVQNLHLKRCILSAIIKLGGDIVPIRYKIDILAALKAKGYNTNKIRREKILAESTLQKLREGKLISLENIGKICELLECQPGDILEYESDETPE